MRIIAHKWDTKGCLMVMSLLIIDSLKEILFFICKYWRYQLIRLHRLHRRLFSSLGHELLVKAELTIYMNYQG